ncbi:MAG: hypothetical protein QOK15_2264, partial [Nocardioidaceae bacterium]|nr:hypothetical protein [Nocardioidaceae bacterium]
MSVAEGATLRPSPQAAEPAAGRYRRPSTRFLRSDLRLIFRRRR